MAEAWGRHLLKGKAEVYSAGTKPSSVNPLAVKVMEEEGIDMSMQRSKHLSEFLNTEFDLVVTLCDSAKEECPFFPNAKRMLHRSFEDPASFEGSEEERLEKFREVRDKIREFIHELEKEL
jgi:arsenate reductase